MEWTLMPFQPQIDRSVQVRGGYQNSILTFRFQLAGFPLQLDDQPLTGTPSKKDLWRETCFELFIKSASGSEYLEWNFSASGEFRMYHFEDIRKPHKREVDRNGVAPSFLDITSNPHNLTFTLRLNSEKISELLGSPPWVIQPTFVFVQDATPTYWAEKHPSREPDFHHFFADPTDPTGWSELVSP